MKFFSLHLLLCLLVCLWGNAFAGTAPTATAVSSAKRIISLSPAMTELVCHLGCQNQLAGRSSACDYPPEIQKLPIVGDFASPNLEKILSLSPDLVLSNTLINPQVAQLLQEQKIQTFIADLNSLDDYCRCLRQLGELLHCPQKAQKEIERATICQQPPTGKKALIVIWENPLIIAGELTWPNEILKLAGMTTPDLQGNKGYFTPSMEWLRSQKLDALITFQPHTQLNLPYPTLFFPNPDLLQRPSPRFTTGIEQLHQLILTQTPSLPTHPSSHTQKTLRALRLWRLLAAFIIGAILSLSGLLFQNLFRNPLASPYTLGISSGAAIGAAAAFVLFSSVLLPLLVPLFSFLGALLTLLLVLWAGRHASQESNSLLLCGVITNVILSSLLIYLISAANSAQLAGITWWTLGDLQALPPSGIVTLLILLLLGTLISRWHAHELNALLLGDEAALAMGIRPRRLRLILILTASLMTSVAVSLAGIIGFVGLIIPHIARRLFSADHTRLIIPTALCGGFFLLSCDQLSRYLNSVRQVPIGLITALAGGLLFLILMRRRHI